MDPYRVIVIMGLGFILANLWSLFMSHKHDTNGPWVGAKYYMGNVEYQRRRCSQCEHTTPVQTGNRKQQH